MGRGNRAYKSAKRNKELQRLKKREEKRLRRLGKLKSDEEVAAAPVEAGAEEGAGTEADSEAPEAETTESEDTPGE